MVEYFSSFNHLSIEALEGEVHVFQLDLAGCPSESIQLACSLLDEEERERAGRLRHQETKRRFVLVRSALRGLLGRYLRRDPSSIRFTLGKKGKPRLAETEPDQGLVFNVSHSGDFGLIALSRDIALGVDVERARAMANLDGMAERCFTPGELAYWRGLPEERRQQAFFEFWSGKEAFLKATGEGISLGLNSVEIVISAREPYRSTAPAGLETPSECRPGESFAKPRLVSIPQAWGKPDEWRLGEVTARDGYIARLCYRGSERRLRMADGVAFMNGLLNITDLA